LTTNLLQLRDMFFLSQTIASSVIPEPAGKVS